MADAIAHQVGRAVSPDSLASVNDEHQILPPYGLEDPAAPPVTETTYHDISQLAERYHQHRLDSARLPYSQGLHLGRAPQLPSELFVGRNSELQELRRLLVPGCSTRNVVAIAAVGGLGKTQLAIRFAELYQHQYSSVFWLDAKDESTLRHGLAGLAEIVLAADIQSFNSTAAGEDDAIKAFQNWLSLADNDSWLLIFDNYDDPKIPGLKTSTGYDLRAYFPSRNQGSILITTRSQKLTFAKFLRLQKLEDVAQSLEILSSRSERNLANDPDALVLARRLDGFPLALTTAGAYLSQTSGDCSVLEYLTLYDQQWHELEKHVDELLEYEDRTLFSTWNLSLEQVEKQNADAAKMLRLLAFFGNSGINFELFRRTRDLTDDYKLDWLNTLTESKVVFNRAMAKLHDYSLVERSLDGYSLHTCIHDWTLQNLNANIQPEYFWNALQCIATNVEREMEKNYWQNNQRLLPHALRMEHRRFQFLFAEDLSEDRQADYLEQVGNLWDMQGMPQKAEFYVLRALKGRERLQGHDSMAVLNSISILAYVSTSLGKFTQAEEMYKRVLAGYEKRDPNNERLLVLYHNLGNLHNRQGDYMAAEQMFLRALEGDEDTKGPNAASTLITANALAEVYTSQKRFSEAEVMSQRALEGMKNVLGVAHPWTMTAVARRGLIHFDQKQWEQAERLWKQVLEDRKTFLGPNHHDTIRAASNLGFVYQKQLRLMELLELVEIWGNKAPDLFDRLHTLGLELLEQCDTEQAIITFQHELNGREAVVGQNHVDTLEAAGSLGSLYRKCWEAQ